MNLKKQRIAIAEACGWTDCHDFTNENDRHGRAGLVYGTHPLERVSREVPDYFSNLNAMHEAEMRLCNSHDASRYAEELVYIVLGAHNDPKKEFVFNRWSLTRLARATAAQRAEAFLRTIEKWRDK